MAQDLPQGFRWADEEPGLPPGFKWADEPPAPADLSPQGAAEAAAVRTRQSVQPAGGRAEGALTRGSQAVLPAAVEQLRQVDQTAEGLMTGRLPPTPENVLPAAAAALPTSVAARTGVGIARAAMTPAEVAQRETGVLSIPRAVEAGPKKQAIAEVAAKIPVIGTPLRKAAERSTAELAEAGTKAAARPTGTAVDASVAGKHLEAAAADAGVAPLGDDAVGKLVQLASNPKGTQDLGLLRGRVPHKDWSEVQSAAIERLGRGPKGAFDPKTYVASYGGLSPGGKNLLFGDKKSAGTLRYHLDTIEAVSRRAPSWQRFEGGAGFLDNKIGRRLAKMAGVGGLLAEPITALSVVIPARVLVKSLAKPVTAAPIAQWSRAYERLVLSGGAPSAFATFKTATDNLRNSIDDKDVKFTAEDILDAPAIQRADPNSVQDVVKLTAGLAPGGIPWKKMRSSENIEDRRPETEALLNKMLSGNKEDFDSYVTRFGLTPTYNLIVDRINKREPVSGKVLELLNNATSSLRRR